MDAYFLLNSKYGAFLRVFKKNISGLVFACCVLFNVPYTYAQVNFGSAASFGLRKLHTNYAGKAIQVRRSSDDAMMDIGFTACGFLDTVTLKTFVGANNAFVATWYDQSGNGRNATQSTLAAHPRVMSAGLVDYSNKRPTIVWPGSFNSGIHLASSVSFNIRTVNAVRDFKLNPFTASGNSMQYLFSSPANADYAVRLSSTGNFSYDGDNNSNDWSNGSGTPKLFWVNGTQTTTPQYALHAITTSGPNVVNGSFSIGTTFLDRNLFNNDAVSELVVYSNTITNTQRTLIETSEAVNFALTTSNSKYTPPTSTSYNLYINGIGRESSTDSVNTTRFSTGMGFKTGTAATDFLKDNGDYITSGINCPITPTTSASNIPVAIMQRWANDWYINKTDVGANNGTLTVYFDFADYGIGSTPGIASNYELLGRSSAAGTFSVMPGTTKSVSGNRVLFVINTSSLAANGYYTLGTSNIIVSPLPVELSKFQCALGDDENVLLNWTTMTEIRNNYFSIERSVDGINYDQVGQLPGAGTSSSEKQYTFEDEAPLNSISYYRLKQVDYDGTFKTYPPCVIDRNSLSVFSVFPNPSDEYVDITSSASENEINTVSVFHSSAKLVFEKQFSGKIRILTADLENGFYIVRIENRHSVITKKLVIQH